MPDHPLANEQVIAAYLDSRRRRWATETLRVRGYQLGKIAASLPVPLVDATEDHIECWDQVFHRGSKPETHGAYVSAIRGIYGWMAVRARPRIIDRDPTVILERPRIPEAQPRPMLDRHYELAIACSLSDPEMYLWMGLMGCSGLRCCEIAWMQVGDVEEMADGTGLLHITGKGGKQRTVPAGATIMMTLRHFLGARGAVFTRESDGRPYTPQGVSQRVSRFLARINVPAGWKAHSLRHRFGTDYHQLDPDVFRQAALMGHSSIDMTRRYTQVSPTEAAEYVERLTQRRLGRRPRPQVGGSSGTAA